MTKETADYLKCTFFQLLCCTSVCKFHLLEIYLLQSTSLITDTLGPRVLSCIKGMSPIEKFLQCTVIMFGPTVVSAIKRVSAIESVR